MRRLVLLTVGCLLAPGCGEGEPSRAVPVSSGPPASKAGPDSAPLTAPPRAIATH